jgi:dipeptidyl aminopeptidase/acylaminoacyl peptidase
MRSSTIVGVVLALATSSHVRSAALLGPRVNAGLPAVAERLWRVHRSFSGGGKAPRYTVTRTAVRVLEAQASVAAAPDNTRLFTPAATADVQAVSDPRLSPDGAWVAYVVTAADLKQNRRRSAIWIAAADGTSEPRVLTTSPQSSTSPRWRPDGKALLFLSSRPAAGDAATDTPRTQAWTLPLDGGEPRRITAAKNGVSNCEWAPDALRIACLSRTGPSDDAGAAASSTRAADTKVYTGIDYKLDGSGWFDDRRAHIWVFTVATGAAKAITSGDQWNDSDLHVKNVRTPVLILHGEADQRVPLSQGEEWFRALRHFGVPAELVVFPRASHGFPRGSEPKQVAEILDRELVWFDKYVANAAAVPSAGPR